MIREYGAEDLDAIMRIWLETNISTHSFIKKEYWENHYDMVKEMIPEATAYVYEEDSIIRGFIGVMDEYIAGIFVLEAYQSCGIGKKLLDYAKAKNDELTLQVYQKNKRAIEFYLREKFVITNEQVDEETGEVDLTMVWKDTAALEQNINFSQVLQEALKVKLNLLK